MTVQESKKQYPLVWSDAFELTSPSHIRYDENNERLAAVVLRVESQADYDAMLTALIDEWKPQGPMEAMCTVFLMNYKWRMLRMRRWEEALINLDAELPYRVPFSLDVVRNMEQHFLKQYKRVLRNLSGMQRMRQPESSPGQHTRKNRKPARPVVI